MYCMSCGKQIAEGTQFCSACGNPVGAQSPVAVLEKRPIAGIAVGTIFGIIDLAGSFVKMFKILYSTPTGIEAVVYKAFPAFQVIEFNSICIGIAGNSALLIGVLMAFLRHPQGNKTVRVTSYCMLAAYLCMLASYYFAITEAEAWLTLDTKIKDSIISMFVAAMLGGIFHWVLLLFLFRKSRWG